jgi:sorbitol/mannitol transport system permease protein
MTKHRTGWHYVIPAMIVVGVMTQVPFLITLVYSTLRWNLARPDLAIEFRGLQNFVHFLQIPNFPEIPVFYRVLWQTVLMTGTALVLCTVLGFLLSLLLDHDIPGVNIARTLMLGPFFVMPVAAGVVWRATMFSSRFGWYGVLVENLGLPRIDFLSEYPMGVIITLLVWRWLPFFILVTLGGLQGLPGDVIDSSKIDGCNWFQETFYIKRPLVQNHMNVAIMLGLVFIIKEFGLILTTTAGGPGTQSYNLPFLVFMTIFTGSQVGHAAAVSVVTVLLTLFLVNLLYKSIQKRRSMFY